jgi:hypothetical protein
MSGLSEINLVWDAETGFIFLLRWVSFKIQKENWWQYVVHRYRSFDTSQYPSSNSLGNTFNL